MEKKQKHDMKKRKKMLKKMLAKWEDKRFGFKYLPLGVTVQVDSAEAAQKLLLSLEFEPRSSRSK